VGRAIPLSGNSKELLPPTLIVYVLALVEVDKHRILAHSQFDGPIFGRGSVNAEELSGIHFNSEDLSPQDGRGNHVPPAVRGNLAGGYSQECAHFTYDFREWEPHPRHEHSLY
jgi:hypothetical protein